MKHRIFIALLVCSFAASLPAQEIDGKSVVDELKSALDKVDNDVASQADKAALLIVGGMYLTYKEGIELATEVSKSLNDVGQFPQDKELSEIKFEISKRIVEELKNADSAKATQLGDLISNLENQVELARKEVDLRAAQVTNTQIEEQKRTKLIEANEKERTELAKSTKNSVDEIKMFHLPTVKLVASLSENALSGNQGRQYRMEDLANQFDAIEKQYNVLMQSLKDTDMSLLPTNSEIHSLKRNSQKFVRGDWLRYNELLEDLESCLAKNPECYELWEELVLRAFAHLQIDRGVRPEYEAVLDRIDAAMKKPSSIEKRLAFLHAYYSAWVSEMFGEDDAIKFYEEAQKYASTPKEKLQVSSKVAEMHLKIK